MTDKVETPKAKPGPKPKLAASIAPLKALHKIGYDGKTVEAETFFVPNSAADREELIARGIARDLTDVEALVAKSTIGGDDDVSDSVFE